MNEIFIRKCFNSWHEITTEKMLSGDEDVKDLINNHLSEDNKYDVALSGSLKNASDEILAHLAFCPVCLKELNVIHEAIHGDIDLEIYNDIETHERTPHASKMIDVADDYYELVSAAKRDRGGAGRKIEAMAIHSECGKFVIQVNPTDDEDWDEEAEVVIKVKDRYKKEFEGKYFCLIDNSKNVILKGQVIDGYLSDFYILSSIDMTDIQIYIKL